MQDMYVCECQGTHPIPVLLRLASNSRLTSILRSFRPQHPYGAILTQHSKQYSRQFSNASESDLTQITLHRQDRTFCQSQESIACTVIADLTRFVSMSKSLGDAPNIRPFKLQVSRLKSATRHVRWGASVCHTPRLATILPLKMFIIPMAASCRVERGFN